MAAITLSSKLAEQLRAEAEQREMSIDELANTWLENQLWQEWHRKIAAESKRFQEKHPELLTQYNGVYVAMRDGAVLDHDADLSALHHRVRAQYGDEPILMAPVTAQPIQSFLIRSPRRERVQA